MTSHLFKAPDNKTYVIQRMRKTHGFIQSSRVAIINNLSFPLQITRTGLFMWSQYGKARVRFPAIPGFKI